MTISERTLKKWRGEALVGFKADPLKYIDTLEHIKELQIRILLMTQELLDQYLIKRKEVGNG